MSEDLMSSSLPLSVLSLLSPKELWNLYHPLHHADPQDLILPECPPSPPIPLPPDLTHSSLLGSQKGASPNANEPAGIKLLLAPQSHQKSE